MCACTLFLGFRFWHLYRIVKSIFGIWLSFNLDRPLHIIAIGFSVSDTTSSVSCKPQTCANGLTILHLMRPPLAVALQNQIYILYHLAWRWGQLQLVRFDHNHMMAVLLVWLAIKKKPNKSNSRFIECSRFAVRWNLPQGNPMLGHKVESKRIEMKWMSFQIGEVVQSGVASMWLLLSMAQIQTKSVGIHSTWIYNSKSSMSA